MKVLKNYPPYLTQGYSNSHQANDIVGRHPNGYNVLDTILAIEDGKVVTAINNVNINTNGQNGNKLDYNNTGNTVVIEHANGYKTKYFHGIYNSVKVKAGDEVKRGQPIMEMGNTGYSFGGHLHLEIWKDGKRLDPYNYVFKGKEFVTLPTPVERDETTRQIEVKVDQLRCRNNHSVNADIIGFTPMGIYNILYKTTEDDYEWYEIETGKWIAFDEDWCNILEPKTVEEPQKENAQNEPTKQERTNGLLWFVDVLVDIIRKIFTR